MELAYIYKGNFIHKENKFIYLNEVSYVFNCPLCPYYITALTKDGIEATRNTHFKMNHIDQYVKMLHIDFVNKVQEKFWEEDAWRRYLSTLSPTL